MDYEDKKTILALFILIIFFASIIGWGKNIIKLFKADFEAPYKNEIIRTIGVFTPLGCIVGFMDINDRPRNKN